MHSTEDPGATQQFDTVIFDVGKVLFDFSFEPFFIFLRRHGVRKEPSAVLALADQRAHEHGVVSDDEFLARIEGHLDVRPDRPALVRAWSEIFTPIPEMHALLTRLRSRYRVLLLSNTSSMHWQELNHRFAIDEMADGSITSHTVGVMKPAPEIYAIAERRYALQPTRTVFIDDIRENTAEAERRGWHTVHHTGAASTAESLRGLGLIGL